MKNEFYPDSKGRYDDRNVLGNAVVFTTAQRARAGARILNEPFERLTDLELAFVAVDAFQQWVQSSEDALGWLFVLRDWKPGTVDGSLFALLDSVRIGRKPWAEQDALSMLEGMNVAAFRSVAHLPSNAALRRLGWPEDLVKRVEPSLTAQLDGFRRIAEKRARGDRALVRAYNKSKHHLLAMLVLRERGLEVDLKTATSGYKNPTAITLTGAELQTDAQRTRQRAREILQMQSVLNSMLAMILRARYGESLSTPGWVVSTHRQLGWTS